MVVSHQAYPPAAAPSAAASRGGGMMRTPRRTTNAAMDGERPVGGGRGSKFQLDLRSVDTDGDDLDGGGQTPAGWLRRTKSMLTPRGGSPFSRRGRNSNGAGAGGDPYAGHECVHVTAAVTRMPGTSLGMELNANPTPTPTPTPNPNPTPTSTPIPNPNPNPNQVCRQRLPRGAHGPLT